jgi:hypothetical protein
VSTMQSTVYVSASLRSQSCPCCRLSWDGNFYAGLEMVESRTAARPQEAEMWGLTKHEIDARSCLRLCAQDMSQRMSIEAAVVC